MTSTTRAADKTNKNPGDALNQDLPHWMKFSLEFRGREQGRTSFGFKEGANDTYTLTRMRIGLDLKPTKWFHLFVQGQDSRVIGIDPSRASSSIKDTFDLRQGYVELKSGEKNWVSLLVGRSELNLGTQRVVGGGDWGNVTRTFDVAKMGLGTSGNRVDIFAATPVIINANRFDKFDGAPGHNLYGVYGTLSKLVPKSTIEPYVLWKTLPLVKSETGVVGNADIYTIGTLWFGKLPAGFDYTVEMDRQAGHSSIDDVSAWAGYWIAGYTLPNVPLKPRFSTEYTYATGDGGKGDRRVSTFDQVYGVFHNIYGMSDLFGWRNIRHLRMSAEVNPTRTVKVTFDFHFLWLASAHDGLYNASGVEVVAAPAGGALSTNIGHDADFYITYSPRPWLTMGTGWSYLFWGQFLKDNAHGIDDGDH
ncbi:MAG: alginate export family protein [Terriglobia bacterium]